MGWSTRAGTSLAIAACTVLAAACAGTAPARTGAPMHTLAKASPEVEAEVNAAGERVLQAATPEPGTLRQEYAPTVLVEGERAVRTVRLRTRDRAGTWERWWLRRQIFARESAGWRLLDAEDTLLYQGKPLSDSLHSRYGGTFMIAPGRILRLAWQGGLLLATLPDGSTRQVFLASPTQEAVMDAGEGELRFDLAVDGKPATVAFVRNGREEWRATRAAPE